MRGLLGSVRSVQVRAPFGPNTSVFSTVLSGETNENVKIGGGLFTAKRVSNCFNRRVRFLQIILSPASMRLGWRNASFRYSLMVPHGAARRNYD